MATLLTGRDELFARWAASRIPHIDKAEDFGKYVAVGIATGDAETDRLMAVVVFHDYMPQFGHCQISCAAADPHWASRQIFRAVLSIPFHQFGCNKVWTATPHTSGRVIKFLKAVGFVQEAVMKDQFGRGVHAVICRMMARDYERVYWTGATARAA